MEPPRTSRFGACALLTGFAFICVGVTTFAAPPTGDEAVPVDGIGIEPFPLEIGPWTATGSAQGTSRASEQGITIVWTGRIPAQFEFVIDVSGTASGSWVHQGTAIQTVSGSVEGQSFEATGTLGFTGGGNVGGNNSRLTLTGSTDTRGTVVADTPAGSISIPISGTETLPTLRLDVAAVSCDEAYGEWAYTLEQAFEGEGFTASFGGYWQAIRGSDEINDNIRALVEAVFVHARSGDGGELASPSPLLRMSAAILQEYNAFIDEFPGWSLDRVLDIARRTEALLAGVRNLTECDKRLFGEDSVETFFNGLTFILQGLIIGSPTDSYSSADFQHLVHVAVRNGALGPGAPNPERAASAEAALIRAGEAILAANVDPSDNLILVNGDTLRVMATGAAMGWKYKVGSDTYDARATYAEFVAR
jgi:hypothetical protein